MQEIKITPAFIKTRNVRNFEVMMDGLALAEGEGRFGMVYGEAGLGKTKTCEKWHLDHMDTVHVRISDVWDSSPWEFLQAICVELRIEPVPRRKGRCFAAIVDSLIQHPKTVFIDEIERLPRRYLDLARDLSDLSMCAFVMIGEKELLSRMTENKRVWDRTFQRLEFQPIGVPDVMLYFKESTGGRLVLQPDCAATLHRLLKGKFRHARRTLLNLVQICNAKKTTDVTAEMIEIAFKAGLGEEK